MNRDTNALIAELVDGLEPAKPLRFSRGMVFVLAGAALALSAVALLFGVRADVLAGRFDPMFLLATGVFLVLGLAASAGVVAMSQPYIGNEHDGWKWAAVMAALLPLAAAFVGLGRGMDVVLVSLADHGTDCFIIGGTLGLLVAAVLVWWLRRGAPTSPERVGLLTGIAAGSLGIFAFSFHCPDSDIVHIGAWHGATVLASAGLGRLVVPRLIRW